jgi:lipid II:glycine glycyltransferase (peptidoglycan interpeptide bridge formation enzyme)
VTAGSGIDEFRTFRGLYDEMRRRKTFESTVDIEEFARIQEDLPAAHRLRILICEEKGAPAAGMVASAMGDSGIYLLGATGDAGLNAKGSYLLQWTMIQWFIANGIRWYDLGGIDPIANPGVHGFKSGMSGTDVFQMNPMVACSSLMSSTAVKAGLAIRRMFRGSKEAVLAPSNS